MNPTLCCAALALAASPAAHAQIQQLDRVEVVGLSPVPGADVARDLIPAHVQTARAADLERSQALDLSAFMNRRLGSVHVNEVQGNPLQPDLNFRGYTASPLLGTQQGLSLYLDGVRLNQPFGDVVSWDLIPKAAIASLSLNPGSNPLFGLNTLGGALALQTKDGLVHPGTSLQLLAGSHSRGAVEFEHGGHDDDGLHWYVTGNRFHERGWRVDSASGVSQLFGKFGRRSGDTELSLSAAVAGTDLNGNGLQEQRLLERDRASVYTRPDNTKNRALLLNLAMSQELDARWTLSGNAYARRIATRTFNGDLNDDSLDQSLYQPSAVERAALASAGFSGFPTAGESAANTPFPKWRCIAQALLRDEPAEKCSGVIRQTRTHQSQGGVTAQLAYNGPLFGLKSQSLVGAAADFSRIHFTQGSELGYLNANRTITGVGAFGDGVTGGNVDGTPYDTRVDLAGRTRTLSAFASTVLTVAGGTHVTLSGRYNHTSVRNRDAITPGGGPGSLDGDHRFSRLNPAIGLSFTPMAGINAWVGVNQGSRAPSAVELGCADPATPCKLPNAFAGDPPLKQVVTTTLEAGLRSAAGAPLAWSLGLFRADNRDDLLFVADNAAGFGYFKNFGKTRRQGLELGLSGQPAQGLTAGANLTLLDATYRTAEVVNGSSSSANDAARAGLPGVDGNIAIAVGDRIPLLPRRMLKLYADLDLGTAWSLGADAIAMDGSMARGNENGQHRPDGIYYLGPGRSAGYAVLNVNAAWRPAKGLKLFAQVSNLLDRAYSTAAQLGPTGFDAAGNFQSRPFPANANGDRPLRHATFYAPGAPRAVSLGLRYEY
ncbi:TonB-dependent receptor [Roseateles sp.]|uniref:TonB-dependent receptor n=1 Tax=Roseateles sp. TaxID=1971397 RepID=UPI0025F96710|nr:TonB-dependent receptor [Roseateles sp.]MBV8037465.1 TonB-dependent receptor [Roseateles sp.]